MKRQGEGENVWERNVLTREKKKKKPAVYLTHSRKKGLESQHFYILFFSFFFECFALVCCKASFFLLNFRPTVLKAVCKTHSACHCLAWVSCRDKRGLSNGRPKLQ